MADELPVVLNSKVWIPQQYVDLEACKQFHKELFFDVHCEKCPFYEERGKGERARPTEACKGGDSGQNCKNYFGRFDLHAEKTTQGVTFHGFPFGNKAALREVYPDVFDHPLIEDRRPRPAMRHNLQFTGQLQPMQQEAVDICFKRSGLLVSKPRTGKTVMAVALICRTGLKTLVLGGQGEWLKGFLHHFVGSPKQAAMTNAPQLIEAIRDEQRGQKKAGPWNKKRPAEVVGIPHTIEDYERLDVCLVTYQQLLQITESGRERMAHILNSFGYVVIDEVDTANATQFSRVVSMLNAAYKFGITATWTRKDGREVLVSHLLGDVLHTTKTRALRPRVVTFASQAVTGVRDWNHFLTFIETSKELFEEIVENALVDLENGHSILCPLRSVDMSIRLYKEINKRYGSLIAAPILGSTHMSEHKRDKVFERCQMGELRFLCGPYQLTRRGVNIPPLSCIYEVLPSSNMQQAEQRMSRILTPEEGKLQPVIKYFLINNKIHASCVKNEYFGFVIPQLRPDISGATVECLKEYFGRYSGEGKSHIGREL